MRIAIKTKNELAQVVVAGLKVIYHPLYSMNNLVTNKSKLPQDGAQVFPVTLSITPIYGVIGYHVTLSDGHMIANHPI